MIRPPEHCSAPDPTPDPAAAPPDAGYRGDQGGTRWGVGGHSSDPTGAKHVGSPEQRRRCALRDAVSEITEANGNGQAAWAIRPFGTGCIAVALAGVFTREAAESLSRALRVLAHAGCQQLIVDLAGLRGGQQHLIRTLGQVRIRFLVAGAQVEWLNLPTELETKLGAAAIESFTATDEDTEHQDGLAAAHGADSPPSFDAPHRTRAHAP